MKEGILNIVKSNPDVSDARIIPAADVVMQDWVRDACSDCMFRGKSWSCPPGVGSLEENMERLREFSSAVFLRFRSSRDMHALERAVLEIESSLKSGGFPNTLGFFPHPCTSCKSCSYPEPCTKPELCRPTGESWGIDLLETSVKAGLPVELVRDGEEFKPVTLLLL
jgi:predicted metal-binding protein